MPQEPSELLSKIVRILYSWSGSTDETPDSTEVLSSDDQAITVGDLKDAVTALNSLK